MLKVQVNAAEHAGCRRNVGNKRLAEPTAPSHNSHFYSLLLPMKASGLLSTFQTLHFSCERLFQVRSDAHSVG